MAQIHNLSGHQYLSYEFVYEKYGVRSNGNREKSGKEELNKNGSYFMICFVESLRGSEGFIMYESVLRHHIRKKREGPLAEMVIPLLGRFKGETGIQHYLQAVVDVTGLKLKFR